MQERPTARPKFNIQGGKDKKESIKFWVKRTLSADSEKKGEK